MPTVFLLLLEASLCYAFVSTFREDAAAKDLPERAIIWAFRLLLLVAMGLTFRDCYARLSAAFAA